MHVGVALVTDSEPAEVVQVREAALHDPAVTAEAGAVCFSTARDEVLDPKRSQQPPVLVVVIAAVGEQTIGLLPRAAPPAGYRPAVQVFQQRQQLRDVVAVAAGQTDGEGDAAGVYEQMVL